MWGIAHTTSPEGGNLMDYSILAIRTSGDDDGRLYPVPGANGAVELEPLDGEPLRLAGSRLSVRELVAGSFRNRMQLTNIKADLLITDSRVLVACSKYDKGGGWWGVGGGGATVALVANGVSKARAAHRRHGKTLVGHVRYPWLRCVGYKPKAGWGSSEELRVGVVVQARDGNKQELFLDVTLPKNVDSSAVARAIVARTARYRLKHTQIDKAAELEAYEALTDAPILPSPEAKRFAVYHLPTYFSVNTATAYPTTLTTTAGTQ
jgi:hypothetical protein